MVEGARRAIGDPESDLPPTARQIRRQVVEPPPDTFADGVEAHRHYRRMCPETEDGCDLGPYIESEARGSDAGDLHGPARKLNFPPFWRVWFSRQNSARLATIDELVDERMERRVLRHFFRRLKHTLVWAFVGAAAIAHWFSDQVAYFVEKLPALKAFWNLVTGAR